MRVAEDFAYRFGFRRLKSRRRRPLIEHTRAADIREWRRGCQISGGQSMAVVGPNAVTITWLDCHFGNARPMWLCPRCDRPIYIIYERHGFACRRCHGLAYAVENMTEHARQLKLAFRIRERLGQTEGGVVVSFPPRPKGRHWHTYLRDRRRGRVVEHLLWLTLARRHGIVG